MKINISKEELARGVQTIQSALSSRTTLPILLNFLMETEDKKVKVISTDLEMGVKHYIKAEIETDGSITIPAKKFADILHSLPDAQDIELMTAGSVLTVLPVLLLFLLRQLTIERGEELVSRNLGIRTRFHMCPYAELGMDIQAVVNHWCGGVGMRENMPVMTVPQMQTIFDEVPAGALGTAD